MTKHTFCCKAHVKIRQSYSEIMCKHLQRDFNKMEMNTHGGL